MVTFHPHIDENPIPIRECDNDDLHDRHKYRFDGRDHICPGVPSNPPSDMRAFDEDVTTRDAAEQFMRECGLDPTPDAIGQLAEVFLPCLRIMCERGYDEEGRTWRAEGWRGMLWKGRDKSDRIWWHGWMHGRFHADSVLDAINYFGYYYRLGHRGRPWGSRGEPGNE